MIPTAVHLLLFRVHPLPPPTVVMMEAMGAQSELQRDYRIVVMSKWQVHRCNFDINCFAE